MPICRDRQAGSNLKQRNMGMGMGMGIGMGSISNLLLWRVINRGIIITGISSLHLRLGIIT